MINNKRKSIIIKIVVPIFIVAIVVSLYFIKNISDEAANEHIIYETPDDSTNNNLDQLEGADFSFCVTSVDIEKLSQYGLPAIIDYGSDGCVPCQNMKPALRNIHARMYRKAFIKYVDVWEHPEAARGIPLNLIPTQAFWNADGTPWIPSERLEDIIGFELYYDINTGKNTYTLHVGPLTESEMMAILVEMGVDAYD